MNRRKRVLSALLPYIMFVCVAVGIVAVVQKGRCSDRRSGREVLRALVITSAEGGGGFRFQDVSTFDQLDDKTHDYLLNADRELSEAGNGSERERAKQRLLAKIPPIECGFWS